MPPCVRNSNLGTVTILFGHLRFGLLLCCSPEHLLVCLSALPNPSLNGLHSLAGEKEGGGGGRDSEADQHSQLNYCMLLSHKGCEQTEQPWIVQPRPHLKEQNVSSSFVLAHLLVDRQVPEPAAWKTVQHKGSSPQVAVSHVSSLHLVHAQ